MTNNIKQALFIILCIGIFGACKKDAVVDDKQFVVRFEKEPERLNPLLSTSSPASQIENMIFQPLAEVDPYTLEPQPVLLEKLTAPRTVETDEYGTVDRLDIAIKKDATWTDGRPVTNEDVLFTLKLIFTDALELPRFKQQFDFLLGEDHLDSDPKFISFYLDTQAFKPEIILTNFYIMPAHVYDSSGVLSSFSLADFIKDKFDDGDKKRLEDFAQQFKSEKYSRSTIVGSGAYRLKNWTTGYQIDLQRKNNWWGDAYSENNLFKAFPEEINYRIIPDQQIAITEMANDNVDIIASVSPEKFSALQEVAGEDYQFLTPMLPRYYYLVLNNEAVALNEKAVRQALGHLVNQQQMIDVIMNGYGRTVTGPLNPRGPFYDGTLEAYAFDVEKAKSLLAGAGWNDSDDDGILDKEIEGAKTDLSIKLNVTGSALGRQIALLLQDNFKQAGVDLEIVTIKYAESRKQMNLGTFDMVATRGTQSVQEVNLSPSWHSSSIGGGGRNHARFANEELDGILDQLEIEERKDVRKRLYRRLHRIIYEEVPVLYLLMPTERILVSKQWDVKASPRRPGYFENLAQPRQ